MWEDSTMRLSALGLMFTFALGLFVAPLHAEAQPTSKVPLLGFLSSGSPSSQDAPFRTQLRELGWHEGRNIAIEDRYAEDHGERLPTLAAELVRLHVDVIVAFSTSATRAAKQATSTIPIIMTGIGLDPVEAGLVTNLARPEGNVTGVVARFGTELWGKRLELFKEAVPKLSRLAVLWNPGNPGNAFCVKEIQVVTLKMGIQLQSLEVRDANAFEHAFAALAKETPDGLFTCSDTLIFAHIRPIADFAVRSGLPTLHGFGEYVRSGGLMSYGTSLPDQLRRAAYYVDKILKGTKPADLPVEQSMKFELVLNLKTAQALGVIFPPTLLILADEVIR
jgi:putative ABC transport system substrate-binding protein